jgi:hypothetical protein
MPTTATTIVASKAARRETDSGFQTQGGTPSQFNHECGTSAVMPKHHSPVGHLPDSWWGRSLDDPSPGHPSVVVGDDHVTDFLGLLRIVRHEHGRNARRDDHLPDQRSELTADLGVESGEWFVEQHQCRLPRQAARQCHSLALTARKRAWTPVDKPLCPDSFEPGTSDRTSFSATASLTDGEGDVVEHRAVR